MSDNGFTNDWDEKPPLTRRVASHLVSVFRFPVFRRLWVFLVVVALYAIAVSAYEDITLTSGTVPPSRTAEAVLSSLLFGLLLQFRTNTSYDRWYEGRRTWGVLVNVSRNLIVKTVAIVRPGPHGEQELRELVREFAVGLRARLDDSETREGHRPMMTVARIYALVQQWDDEGKASTWQTLAIDAELREFLVVAGICERIRATPLVASYKGLLRKGIGIYLLGVPWLVVADAGWFTVPITLAIAYVMIALELVADDIEDPFGHGADDLQLDEVVRVIDRSSRQELPAGDAVVGR